MKRVLVTGMSGTGKSTLLAELADRGYWTVDTDYGGYVESVAGESLWVDARVDELLSVDDPRGVLFVQGTVRNQVTFYPRFDHVVLLSAPEELIVERLRSRTTNSFGRSAHELAAVLDDLAQVEPLLRAAASVEVVTTMPVAQVADAVLAHVGLT
ncbi:AAA family ATPase [Mycolicibacterium hodleri]|uniref:AAA family ATPase n=1 Tax=Mycolicibacterium hodleri TaxID=49897 RepID=UPI0021F31140|nr:AAA family ATPase [Mycolicibacterium hodleri]